MIEIDSNIIDSNILYERIKATAKTKEIPAEFYGDFVVEKTSVADLNQLHNMMKNVYQNLQMMNATWPITEKPFISARPIIGGLIVFGKRVFRKLTRWLFQPYYQQQTDFNGAATRTISDMIKVQEMLIHLYETELKGGVSDAN